MVSGLLTGAMTAERVADFPPTIGGGGPVEFNEPRLSRNLRLVELLREIGSSHGVGPGVVRWPGRFIILLLRQRLWAVGVADRLKDSLRRWISGWATGN